MKTSRLTMAAAFFAGLVLPLAAQAAESGKGIPGILDPATGAFTVRPALAPAAAPLTKTGIIVVKTTVEIDSAIPADLPISCSISISSFDTSFSNSAFGSNNVVRSGASGTCTTVIHYIWLIANASTMMNVSVSINTSSFGPDTVSHNASSSFAAFPVPTGTKSLAVKLAL